MKKLSEKSPETPEKLEIPSKWSICEITGRIDVLNAEWFSMNGCIVDSRTNGSFVITKDTFRDYGTTIDDGLQTCWDNWKGQIEINFY